MLCRINKQSKYKICTWSHLELNYILYVDANRMFGSCLKLLPYQNFEFDDNVIILKKTPVNYYKGSIIELGFTLST